MNIFCVTEIICVFPGVTIPGNRPGFEQYVFDYAYLHIYL